MNYQDISNSALENIKRNKTTANQISYVRLFLACIEIFLIYSIIRDGSSSLLLVSAFAIFFLFLFLVNRHQRIIDKVQYYQAIHQVCVKEIAAEKGNIQAFDDGKEYEEKGHFFSFDLDIFDNHSIFQLLNRSITQSGKDTLAHQLKFPFLSKEIIIDRQKSIEELKNKVDWRVDFLANGSLLKNDETKYKELTNWLKSEDVDLLKSYKFLLWLVPAINFTLLGLWIFDVISFRVWLATLVFQSLFSALNRKKLNALYLNISKNTTNLQKYVELFRLVEKEDWQTPMLKSWKELLSTPEFISVKIKKLANIAAYFAVRNNFFGPILNAFLLWDYQCAYQFELWKRDNSHSLLQSFETLHQLEVLISLACYEYANPAYVVPEISDHIILDAQQLGHPLLKREKSVNNDFGIKKNEQIFIVTGANMAGKSTFLRAIGSNFVLAMLGTRVCAEKFSFKPIQIYTCMRITDSIEEGESYFHAELLRLQRIVKLLEEGKEVFVILDELLKGTNSKDKLLGSELFLEKLIQYKTAFGMIATHDLDLTAMATKYPDTIKNICFEIIIEGDKMTFDYKLRSGVTQNMNALFLMKQMGIV